MHMHTDSKSHNRMTSAFLSQGQCMQSNRHTLNVDSSIHFSFSVQTHRDSHRCNWWPNPQLGCLTLMLVLWVKSWWSMQPHTWVITTYLSVGRQHNKRVSTRQQVSLMTHHDAGSRPRPCRPARWRHRWRHRLLPSGDGHVVCWKARPSRHTVWCWSMVNSDRLLVSEPWCTDVHPSADK